MESNIVVSETLDNQDKLTKAINCYTNYLLPKLWLGRKPQWPYTETAKEAITG